MSDKLNQVVGAEGGVSVVVVGNKADSGKPMMGEIPPCAMLDVAKVLTFGAGKYGRGNWRAVDNARVRYLDAAIRHINAYQRGELTDDESGESHLAHAVCSLLFIMELSDDKANQGGI